MLLCATEMSAGRMPKKPSMTDKKERIGIEKINFYPGKLRVSALDLAEARERDRTWAQEEAMLDTRSVVPLFEDSVSLAINAADRLLEGEDKSGIELLIVATESAVDFGKPISGWVHRFCDLPSQCRSFEIKHACYGGTAALKMAMGWLMATHNPDAKALIVSSDFTRPGAGGGEYDFVGGGCAVALLVSRMPHILELDLRYAGYFTQEIADSFRPTSRHEIINNQTSLYAYLDALDGALDHYTKVVGEFDYDATFKRHIYHAPFPGMTWQAHRTALSRWGVSKKEAKASYEQKVRESISIARQIGTAYGASNFISLLGLLHSVSASHSSSSLPIHSGDCISIYAYGSGCQGEFYAATLGEEAVERVRALDIDTILGERPALTVSQFESLEASRRESIDSSHFTPPKDNYNDIYTKCYDGRGLVVLEHVEDFCRHYTRT